MTPHFSDGARHAGGPSLLVSVKYSLAELLAEIDQEKDHINFAQDKLPQVEIAKLFKNQSSRRGTPSN